MAVNTIETAKAIFEKFLSIKLSVELRTMYETWFNTLYQPFMNSYIGVPTKQNPTQPQVGQMEIYMTGPQPTVQVTQHIVCPSTQHSRKLSIRR